MFRREISDYRAIQWGEKLLLFYLAGILAGIILLQFPDKEVLARYGFFSESTIERLRYMDVNTKGLFFYCFRKRSVVAILLVIFAMTNLAPIVASIYTSWIGFGTGAWITVASVRYGILGPLLYLGIIMPQALCYLPAFLLYIRWMAGLYMEQERPFGKMVQLFIIFLVFLVGILLESYVNPSVLKNFIKIFL